MLYFITLLEGHQVVCFWGQMFVVTQFATFYSWLCCCVGYAKTELQLKFMCICSLCTCSGDK